MLGTCVYGLSTHQTPSTPPTIKPTIDTKWRNSKQHEMIKRETKFKNRQQQEILALQKRIQTGREESKKQRQMDLERLLQRYQNVKSELEAQQNLERIRFGQVQFMYFYIYYCRITVHWFHQQW